MPHELRDYQDRAIDATIDALGDNPILVMPTGSGKTVTAAAIVKELGHRTLWLAHRRELVKQAADQLRELGLRCGVIMADEASDPDAPVQVASVQTAMRRDMEEFGLVVVDEAHHAVADSYAAFTDLTCPLLGLTATPFRLDGKGLRDAGFRRIIVGSTVADLVERGFLVEPEVFAAPIPADLRNVNVRGGDYAIVELSSVMNTIQLVGNIVDTWKKRSEDGRTVCFAVDIEHSRHITRRFADAGLVAEHLDGTTPKEERDAILARLRDGTTRIVSNCMVLTEGWDLPALEVAVIARPTRSLNLHLQMIGRIMRACEGKRAAMVLDHAGNHHVHGTVTQLLEYSLDERVKRLPPPMPPPPPRDGRATPDIEEVEGELEPFAASAKAPFAVRGAFFAACVEKQRLFRYKTGYPAARYKDHFGAWPVHAAGRLIDTEKPTMDDKRAYFDELETFRRARGFAAGWTAHKYRAAFGVWPRGVR
jgi:superfamily II DNA or RNA helicase